MDITFEIKKIIQDLEDFEIRLTREAHKYINDTNKSKIIRINRLASDVDEAVDELELALEYYLSPVRRDSG